MRFEILGPLRVAVATETVALTAHRERTLLAMLLLHANRTVPVAQLVEAIWAADPPPGVRNQLQGSVSRLRRRLASAGGPAGLIVTEPAGYRVTVGPDQLDLLRFRHYVAEARRTAGQADRTDAINHYRAALALWHGPALAGIDSDPIRRFATALDEEHFEVLEERIGLELETGAGQVVAELTDLVGRYPHREGLHRALMLALYRTGRQGDALAAYRRARRLLHDELGVEPGAELQRLHQAILNRDSALDTLPRAESARVQQPVKPSLIPRELPADVAVFTGRDSALKTLDGMLSQQAGPVVISAIAGTAGVGKTALAIHWAHQVADHFPDGQLYLNLRGYATDAPARPIEALAAMLRSLGVPPEQIPSDEAQAAALFRTRVADKRVLVVLDNAGAVGQVRPLLPGSPGCLVLITSRDRLAGLVARDGAHRLILDVLTPDESTTLLTNLLGPVRTATEPEAAAMLAQTCAHLPLALRIASAHLTDRPDLSISAYLTELARDELKALRIDGDDQSAIHATLDLSYQRLPTEGARLFRLLGLIPGPDFAAPAAAALANTSHEQAEQLLAILASAHLVEQHEPGRYTFHDLLRAYAGELAGVHEPADQQRAAQHRLYDYYLHTAHLAAMLLQPLRDPIALPSRRLGVIPEQLADHERAVAWFVAEYPVLLGAIRQAARAGFDTHVWQLAWSLRTFFERRGHWHDMATTHRTALEAARRTADPTGLAQSYRGLAGAHLRLGQFDAASTCLRRALDLFRELGEHIGQAQVLLSLGHSDGRMGRLTEAIQHVEQSLDQFRASGSESGQANALNDLGWYHSKLGRHRDALDFCRQALELHQRSGNEEGLAHTWDSLGYVHHHLGDRQEAVDCYRTALRIFRSLGDRYYEANTLTNVGDTYQAADDPATAGEAWDRALAILEELDHPDADQVRARLRPPAQL